MKTKSGNIYRATGFNGQGSRRAGHGMIEDDYSGEHYYYDPHRYERVRFPNDGIDPEELNGKCIVVKVGKKKN